MTREDMVHKLVTHSVQSALAESRRYWLSDLFERGFAGYRNLSTDELRRELQLRGLVGADDGPAEEVLDDSLEDFDGQAEWDDEIERGEIQCGLHLRGRAFDD